MMGPGHGVRYTWREYLALESVSNTKHEYFDGQIYAMAGRAPDHAALQVVVASLLFPQLRSGPCRAFGPDLRVRVLATGLATYPDGTIVCGPREVDPEYENALINPTVLFEVLSPSTEAYDRGEKFGHYKRIPTLRQYVLVAQGSREIEVWTRTAEGAWESVVSRDGEIADLGAIGAQLDVREVYKAAADVRQ